MAMIPLPLPAGQRKLTDVQLLKQALAKEDASNLAKQIADRKMTYLDEQPMLQGGNVITTPTLPEQLKSPVAQGTPTELPEQLQNRPLLQPPIAQRPEDAIETVPEMPEFMKDKGYVTKESEPIEEAKNATGTDSIKEAIEGKTEENLKNDFGVENIPIGEIDNLKEFDRTDPEVNISNIDKLQESIKAEGFKEPLIIGVDVVKNKALLLEGNHRLAAAQKLGLKNVPVRVEKMRLNEEQLKKANTVTIPRDSHGFSQINSRVGPSQIGIKTPVDSIKKALQTPQKDGFISKIAEAAIKSKGDVITKQQAENLPAKKSEKEAIDLETMFKGRKSIPKEEFAQKVTDQMPEVRVIEKGKTTNIVFIDNSTGQAIESMQGASKEADIAQRAKELRAKGFDITVDEVKGKEDDTKFRQHIKEPVENYRELYITAPIEDRKDLPNWNEYTKLRFQEKDYTPEEEKRLNELDKQFQAWKDAPTFKTPSAHETGDPEADTNRIGHIFMGDVTSDKGRGLQLLEEQNDWEREGIEKGFDRPTTKDELAMERFGKKYDELSPSDKTRVNVGIRERGGAVPNHPLTKNSRELNLKKFLQKAVEGDYNYITSVTGEQVADRYDLSKQVDSIDYEKDRLNKEITVSINKGGERVDVKKFPVEDAGSLEQYVGKDVAKKIGESKELNGTLSGLDLKIGGEWHKKRYDRDNWKTLEKLTGAKSEIIDDSGRFEIKRLDRDWGGAKSNTTKWDIYDRGSRQNSVKTRKEAQKYIDEHTTKQRAIIMTPEIKERIKRGLPLFAKKLSERRVA